MLLRLVFFKNTKFLTSREIFASFFFSTRNKKKHSKSSDLTSIQHHQDLSRIFKHFSLLSFSIKFYPEPSLFSLYLTFNPFEPKFQSYPLIFPSSSSFFLTITASDFVPLHLKQKKNTLTQRN